MAFTLKGKLGIPDSRYAAELGKSAAELKFAPELEREYDSFYLAERRSQVRAFNGMVCALAIWAFASLLAATGPVYASNWTNESETIDAFALAARQPGLCGVGLVGVPWGGTPGSAALPPGVPIYVGQASDVGMGGASYNVAITDRAADLAADRFRRAACFDGTVDLPGRPSKAACVWGRGGGCTPGAASRPAPNWPPFFLDAQGRPRQGRIQAYSRAVP